MWVLFYLFQLVVCQQAFRLSENSEYNELSTDTSAGVGNEELHDFEIKGHSLVDFLRNMIEIESVSGNELAVSDYIAGFLESNGLIVELQPVTDKRVNVYAYYQERENKILLTSHIDTVPPYMSYRVEGSRIYGRGSCDDKGLVASQVFSYLSLIEDGQIQPGDVGLMFVVGEEADGIGMKTVSDSFNTTWDIGIFGEPTELKLGVGHKGILHTSVQVTGKTAHSGYPQLGISATEIMVPILNKFLEAEYPSHELLGPTTMNIGKVEAGVAANVIPAYAYADLIFRVANDLPQLMKIVSSILDNVDHLEYTFVQHTEPQFLEFEVPGFESIVLAYGTDIPNYTHKLSKRYLYGPGTIHVAHSDHEYVDSKDLVDAVEGYKKLIKYNLEN